MVTYRVKKNERGAVFVEASLFSLLLFFLIFAGIDLLHLSYVYVAGNFSIAEAASEVKFGQQFEGHTSRLQTAKSIVVGKARAFGLSAAENDVRVCSAVLKNCEEESAVVQGELITVMLTQRVRLITLGGVDLQLDFEAIERMEEF